MLSVFPTLLSFQLIVPVIFRLIAGIIFVGFGYDKLMRGREEKLVFFEKLGLKPAITYLWVAGIVEIVGGVFLIVGFLTQLAALILSLIALSGFIIKRSKKTELKESAGFFFLLFAVTLSLLFLGPGTLAFDLPL